MIWNSDRDTTGDGTLDERLYVVQDANHNVTALFDNSGNVVERYVYDPFGSVTVLDAGWNVLAASAFAWVYLHQGGRYDSASGLYHFRHRDYSPTLGRWTSLDPIRYAAGDVNLYRALGNGSISRIDPTGLNWREWLEYGKAAAEGLWEGGKNLVMGAGEMVIEMGQIARDTGNAAISAGSMLTDWAFGTGVYQFDLHSKTIGGYDLAVKSGSGGTYLANAMANGASLGIKPLIEGVIDFAQTGDATNASRTAGGVAAGNLAGAAMLKVGGPAWAEEPITLWRPRPAGTSPTPVTSSGGTVTLVPQGGNAAARLPQLQGMSRADAHIAIRSQGFQCHGTTRGGYVRYRHPDGSEVWIRPNGEVIRLGPKPLGQPHRPRYDPSGNVGKHPQGEFLPPLPGQGN
jgi:RHS repeat-associated protein